MLKKFGVGLLFLFFMNWSSVHAQEGFIGEIKMFAGNFAPRGWALCDGQYLPIAQNAALFSIIGTIYGGDGRTTFALPDLRGRVALHQGSGPGLPLYRQGQKGGGKQINVPVVAEGNPSQKVNDGQPYLAVNYIICLQGVFPSRN